MSSVVEGRARRFGDHVNTDYIVSSTRKRDTLDVAVLKQYLFESIDPAFAATVAPGDVIVAGRNFGCGSAMEIVATVLLAAGIRAVLAESFARTFYRNAINNGLLPVVCDTGAVSEGDQVSIAVSSASGIATVSNLTTGRPVGLATLPPIMLDILESGGLVPYLRTRGRFVV
jgi:3-isopropylmalate/(R)-2-methylmalate dehydratase small subunit